MTRYPLNHEGYQQWVEEHQTIECAVCYGRGWVEQEDASGAPSREVPCPYCHGTRRQGWVPAKRQARFDKWDKLRMPLIIATIVLVVLLASPVQGAPIGLVGWFVVIGWPLYLVKRRPKYEKPGYTPKHAPGFTDDHEHRALGLFAMGLAVRQALSNIAREFQSKK